MKKLISSLCALCLALSAAAQGWWGPQSRTEEKTLRSEVLGTDRQYSVYLPASYDVQPEKRYPVLYLLHGLLDTHKGWFERGHVKDVMDQLVASGEACEMIIVTPNAGGNVYAGEWNGYFDMEGWPYERFFFEELMPAVEKEYRIEADRSHRAVAGLSMGGGGATSYAQRHSDLFCACYAMSALMMTPDFGGAPQQQSQGKQMDELNKAVADHNCITFVAEADDAAKAKLREVAWFVDCGDDDFLLPRNWEFYAAMRQAGIPCQLRVRDGGHTWEYWHSALYSALPFVTRQFSK